MEPALEIDSHIMSLSYFDMFTKKFATYTYTSYMCTYIAWRHFEIVFMKVCPYNL
jgi:hypothetical protein